MDVPRAFVCDGVEGERELFVVEDRRRRIGTAHRQQRADQAVDGVDPGFGYSSAGWVERVAAPGPALAPSLVPRVKKRVVEMGERDEPAPSHALPYRPARTKIHFRNLITCEGKPPGPKTPFEPRELRGELLRGDL